jgi:hypothetical protein
MENTTEIWKPIPNYEGLYEVSNFGRVKSLNRAMKRNNGTSYYVKETILKHGINHDGYRIVSLSVNSKSKTRAIHQLVAEAFLSHIPNGQSLVVNHKDFNRQNNHVGNLEVTTMRENSNRIHLPSSSKYIGVCWYNKANKWMARIRINGRQKYLGIFSSDAEASEAYQKELNKLLTK